MQTSTHRMPVVALPPQPNCGNHQYLHPAKYSLDSKIISSLEQLDKA